MSESTSFPGYRGPTMPISSSPRMTRQLNCGKSRSGKSNQFWRTICRYPNDLAGQEMVWLFQKLLAERKWSLPPRKEYFPQRTLTIFIQFHRVPMEKYSFHPMIYELICGTWIPRKSLLTLSTANLRRLKIWLKSLQAPLSILLLEIFSCTAPVEATCDFVIYATRPFATNLPWISAGALHQLAAMVSLMKSFPV